MIDISLIIISYNTLSITKNCLDSLNRFSTDVKKEIIVIDNGSTDGSVNYLKKLVTSGKIKAKFNRTNLGFAKANNKGMEISKGRYILLINSDVLFKSLFLSEMIQVLDKNKKIGIASCQLLNPDGSVQGTGGYFPTLIRVFSWMTLQDLPYVDHFIRPFHPMKEKSFSKGKKFYQATKELDWVTGAFFLIRRQVYDQIGGFDTDYFMYTEETDYCYRTKQVGWKVFFYPKWSVIHMGGASGKKWSFVNLEFNGVKLFYKKHYPKWHFYILRFLFKLGCLWRMPLFGLVYGRDAFFAYATAFIKA